MPIDMFGYDNAIQQQNDRSSEVQMFNQGVQDWNNKIMTQYHQDKGTEGLHDDASYVKDAVSNIMGANGLNQAYKNNKSRVIDEAKKSLRNPVTSISTGEPQGIELDTYSVSAPPQEEGNEQAVEGGEHSVERASTGEATDINTSLGEGVANSEADRLNDVISTDVRPEKSILGSALNKVTGGALGEDEARTIGKVGGAVVNATMGGIDLKDDVDELITSHGKHLFNPDNSTADDWDNALQVVAGASDIVGLIPGLEWVAGLGNIAGEVGGVIGMFGDHTKNIQHDQNVENEKAQIKQPTDTMMNTGQVAQTSQSTLQALAKPQTAY